MAPAAGPALDHASTIRNLLWIVAAALAAVELVLTLVPNA